MKYLLDEVPTHLAFTRKKKKIELLENGVKYVPS